MEYSNYYEQTDFYGNPIPQKKRRGGMAAAIIITAIISFALGAVVACLLMPRFLQAQAPAPTPIPEATAPELSDWPQWLPDFEEFIPFVEPETSAPTPTPTPVPTPLPTERPLPEFDGQSPVLPQSGGYSNNPIPDIVESCAPGVVGINVYDGDSVRGYTAVSGGTGFVISSDGYIATNAHVVEGASLVRIAFGEEEVDAEVIGMDLVSDLAVVKVEKEGLVPLKIGDSEALRVGDFVIAIGDPTIHALTDTTTFGIVSALDREVNIDGNTNEYIQTDAAINPGNSGGPLINMQGEVVGITSVKTLTAGYDSYGNKISAEGLGFAIPISDAMPIIKQLITQGRVQRPGVGISIVQFTETERERLGIPAGVMIYSVYKDSPANIADLRKYDVITACNGVTAVENDAFVDILQSMNVGDTVVFSVWRDGEEMEITVTIGDLNLIGNEEVQFAIDERYGW